MNRLRRWWKRRQYRVECETCGARVKPKKAVVLEGTFETFDGPGLITATYCKADAPKEAA